MSDATGYDFRMHVRRLQSSHAEWLRRNFPDQDPTDGLLGIVEEVGEVAHAVLKQKQGIRTDEDHAAKERDGLGDIFIYMLSHCNTRGIDLAQCIEEAWSEVSRRDWASDPVAGAILGEVDPDGAL